MPLLPHLWTAIPRLRHSFRPIPAPPSRPWEGWVEDPQAGRVRLNGWFRQEPGGDEALLLVHGLGGSVDSHYMLQAARAAQTAGLPCLRLNLRGSDRQGEDYYHAGLTADVHAALAAPELAPYSRLYLLGYSLGGHVALSVAAEEGDPRLMAAAAVCSPVDLALSVLSIDAPSGWPYRRYVLHSLNQIYAGVAARRPVPYPVEKALRIPTIREWDDRIVAPRHGFLDAADYYARASVVQRLNRLRIPALLLNAEYDPMVSAATVRLGVSSPRLTVRFLREGGHVAFPAWIDTGLAPGEGLEAQLFAWLRAAAARN